ncbi:unnamed protein product [Bursaphelenchus xylophilus]|uniref:(pine wood nematode) hypothetical protein n=1 Tax=Bursaphelenchus xylophilus TaxID=6326 RepID=A0A1I7RV36_BURXY|nr:unnamed protein product [Bursaphelenchus xylophilus]CAG9105148.1 unnamed protein product [Bursaphelenchus xylophilus]
MAGRILSPKIDFPGSDESFDDIDLTSNTPEPSRRQEQRPMLTPANHIVIHEVKGEPEETTDTATTYFEMNHLPFIAMCLLAASASLLLHRSLPMDVALLGCIYGIFSCYCLLRWKSVLRYIIPAIFVAFILGKAVTDLSELSIHWERTQNTIKPATNATNVHNKLPYFNVMSLGIRVLVLFVFAFVYDLLGFAVVDHYRPFFRSGYKMLAFVVCWITVLTGVLAGFVALLAYTGYVNFE